MQGLLGANLQKQTPSSAQGSKYTPAIAASVQSEAIEGQSLGSQGSILTSEILGPWGRVGIFETA